MKLRDEFNRPSAVRFTDGDIFTTPADIRVNTVNCVGVMGAGVALACKRRFPEMFREYRQQCRLSLVRPGRLHVWKSGSGDWIINFPTKRHWRDDSRYVDIEAGLVALRDYLSRQGRVRVALPALGCGHGRLDWMRVTGHSLERCPACEEGGMRCVQVLAPMSLAGWWRRGLTRPVLPIDSS